jgi:hypothetical protein
MSPYGLIVGIILGGWLVASVIAQNLHSYVWRFDLLNLLPNCHFFAPKPVSHDMALFIRSHGLPTGPSDWQRILPDAKRSWCFIWNPQHRIRKALFEMLMLLQTSTADKETCHISYPYLVFLNLASSRLKGSPRVQFLVTAFEGHESSVQKLVFLSYIHQCQS